MSFDNSRFTFDAWKNYSGVVMEQGRVQLDADWNEWLAELSRRIQAGTLDVFGHAAYPPTTPSAFLITATSGSPSTVTIGAGRMYVDGLLAENHGSRTTASWDPALAELSGAPQPPDLTHPNPSPLDFTKQELYPGATLPTDVTQSYVFYLDVWVRPITYLEDPGLVDKAVGVDTTGRLQTVWQVKWTANTGGWTCATPDSQIFPPHVPGQLTTGVVPNAAAGPCCLTDNTGYTGVENQLYRVEMHQAGGGSDPAGKTGALFKWSRDNASVQTAVLGIATVQNSVNQTASALTVTSLGRDEVLGFKNGDWIELLDDWAELWGQAGVLCQIDSVSVSPPTITLTTTVNTTASPPGGTPSFPVDAQGQTDPERHTRIRRWDQSGKVYDVKGNLWCDVGDYGGAIPVPASDTTLVLENGVTVQFHLPSGATFDVGDFWTFAARTADGTVDVLDSAPPRGIHHHYTKLSVVTFGPPTSNTDCRTPSGGSGGAGCGCCTVTVGDGTSSVGQYTSIQAAINALPPAGGEVCILPGRYYEYVTLYNLHDVVIYGCGAETRLASPTMKPGPIITERRAASTVGAPASGLAAIITVVGSTNVKLRSFAVEAADGEAGILLDGTVLRRGLADKNQPVIDARIIPRVGDFPSNVTISELALTASTLPALVAVSTSVLEFTNNRVAMEDVGSQWPAVWVSGSEIHIDHNWIGLQDAANAEDWMPVAVVNDVPAGFNASVPKVPLANGGIQVAGRSRDVFIVENEIEGGARNGITLGSFGVSASKFVRQQGVETIFGLLPNPPVANATTFSLLLPPTTLIDGQEVKLLSGGTLENIRISRNRIRNVGLCGIGPVGFFDLLTTLEVISIRNLVITDNVISASVEDTIAPTASNAAAVVGYGAICVADAENLVVQGNIITDFGDAPGALVCGIFVLCGEQVEIGRNQVLETRDWAGATDTDTSTARNPQGGVVVLLATPPALDQRVGSSSFAQGGDSLAPLYQPGLPAIRIENNVVRVALGLALEVVGFGPFSIVGNQLSTGGPLPAPRSSLSSGFLTAVVLNLGRSIDVDSVVHNYAALYATSAVAAPLYVAYNPLASSSSGAVVFTNNVCQLEARVSRALGVASVGIFSLDQVMFSGNHCWMDGRERRTALVDALVLGVSLQATGNRFQEARSSVLYSALTVGIANITTHNMGTYCVVGLGAAATTINAPNVVFDRGRCPDGQAVKALALEINDPLMPAINAADTTASQRVQGLGLVHQARLAQFKRAAVDAAEQYGASSPQAKAAEAAVSSSEVTVSRLAIMGRQVTLTPPTVAAGGWSLYGHVYDSQLKPVSAYTVFVVDAQNAYQGAIGFAYTASDGSFQLVYAPGKDAAPAAQLFLQIANAKGQPVYLGTAPLQPQEGAATLTDITLPAGEPVIGDPPAALRAIALPPTGAPTPPGGKGK